MSFHPKLQSAPVRHGTVSVPELSPWTGTSDPYFGARYFGDEPAELVVTVGSDGTVGAGTLVCSYDDGLGNTGSFSIGSDYTADDPIQIGDGSVTIYFPAGTVKNSDDCTVDLNPTNELIPGHQTITGDLQPTAIEYERTSPVDRDDTFTSWDYRTKKSARAILRAPMVRLDYVGAAGHLAAQRLKHNRHLVTFGENYDEDTQLLWRGSNGLMPIIGPHPVYENEVVKVYYDADVGLLRTAAVNKAGCGYPLGNTGASIDKMLQINHPDSNENLITQAHCVTGTTGWQTASGSPTLDIVNDVLDIIDRDDAGFPNGFSAGVLRALLDSGDAVETTNATVSSGVAYSCAVWIRGRGEVTVKMEAGGTKDSETVDLTGDEGWQYITLSGTTSSSTFNLEIDADDDSIVYISMAGVNEGKAAIQPLPSNGGAITAGDEELYFDLIPSMEAGSISLWVQDLMDDSTGSTRAIVDGNSGDFAIMYDYSNAELDLRHDVSGDLLTGDAVLQDGDVHNIVAVWERGSGDNLVRELYFDGVSIAGPTSTSDWEAPWGTRLNLMGDIGAEIQSMLFAEVRVDRRRWTAAEVLSQYERMTEEHWIKLHRELAGRQFWIQSMQEMRRSKSNPEQWIIDVQLTEGDSEDSGLVLLR